MDINSVKNYFSVVKARKSIRLQRKNNIKTQSLCNPLGRLGTLPLEVFYLILDHLPVEVLSILAMVSKCARDAVELYSKKRTYLLKNMMNRPLDGSSLLKFYFEMEIEFHKFGLLLKRTTCLYSTKERLRIFQDFLFQMKSEALLCNNFSNKLTLWKGYGSFFRIILAGWHESECTKMFESMDLFKNMGRETTAVLESRAGKIMTQEYKIRSFYRYVILDPCRELQENKAFWLTRILKPYTMFHQAKLLYILYGPLFEECIDWFGMSNHTPGCFTESQWMFLELSKAIRLLRHYDSEWSNDDILSILEDLIAIPNVWLQENIANFLFYCESDIVISFLGNRAINGRLQEIAELVSYSCLICNKFHSSIEYVSKITKAVLGAMSNGREKTVLLNKIATCFHTKILECHERELLDIDEDDETLMMWVDAQYQFSCCLLHKTFMS